ncbi:SRPBCC domain-containing protein [Flavobacterium sp. NST-5]|uniref:SRPBCC domain-containing protein n=1 Tax=Flavobacterium ichthyis TaxID=2698827 RepID=A0ABW9ZEQ2_9FLAO|nr:SRPBCC domain-containing protein [Flavobacterium ichthyis]NBL65595.1 SRPBCC domain-containing protein [Flavobacterium ichthyis]
MVDIRHTLVIEAAPHTIYNALTTAGGLSAWWTPNVQAISEVGSIAKFPFERDYVKHMEIVELLSDVFVKWRCVEGDKEWINTEINFKLVQKDLPSLQMEHPEVKGQLEQNKTTVKTVLIFEHRNWKAYSPSFAECSYTWAIFLRSLKLYCETGKGTPWPSQHQIS